MNEWGDYEGSALRFLLVLLDSAQNLIKSGFISVAEDVCRLSKGEKSLLYSLVNTRIDN